MELDGERRGRKEGAREGERERGRSKVKCAGCFVNTT